MGKQTLKKGDTKALSISHPNSRKAKALAKKIQKGTVRQKIKSEFAIKRNLLFGEKALWFQEQLKDVEECTATLLDELFEKYLSRFDEELEQISIKHSIGQRKNRQHANREDIINMTKKRELEEYSTCGIEMVNVLIPQQLALLREWNGNYGGQFKIRRFSKLFLTNYKAPNKPKDDNKSVPGAASVDNNNRLTDRIDESKSNEEYCPPMEE